MCIVRFCVDAGYNSTNVLEELYSLEWIESFHSMSKKQYLSDKKISDIIDSCINPQDSVIVQLLFEGVAGNNLSEILNLKLTDVQEGSILKLNDNGKYREVKVSQKCIELIYKAYNQEEYQFGLNKKGNVIKQKLISNGCVIKCTAKGRVKGELSSYQLINERLKDISKSLKIPQFKSKYIIDCGIIASAKDIYVNNGYLTEKKALQQITKQFKLSKYKNKSYEYYPPKLRQLISADNIYNTYNLKFYVNDIEPFKLVDESLKHMDSNIKEIAKRIRQAEFRDEILLNYSERCSITNETTKGVLEAAHIQNYINAESHHPQNGILFRVDFHKLFDIGLISISDDYKLIVSPKVNSNYYLSFQGKKLHLPDNKSCHPSKLALQFHRNKFKENFNS